MNATLLVGRTSILALALLASAAAPATAQLINLNFTGSPYTGDIAETSPATPGGPAGTWNNLTTGVLNELNSYETDGTVVLLSDGSPGPTLTFDASSGTSSGTNWNGTSLSFSAVDYSTAGGVYNVANLYESGLINGGNATTGFRVKGLTPGTYEVYLVPIFRNAQAAGVKADPAVNLTIGLGNDIDARNAGGYDLDSTAINVTQNVDTRLTNWVAAVDGSTNSYNHIGATVAIDSTNRWVAFLLGDSSTTGPDRPGPAAIQLRLTSSSQPTAPRITSIVVSGPSVIISGTNGTHNGTYQALRSGSLPLPFGSWSSVFTGNFDNDGNFSFTNTPSGSPSFYIIEQQP